MDCDSELRLAIGLRSDILRVNPQVCGYHKYLASYVDKSGNRLGAGLQFDASGDITDVSNETRQRELRLCWP